MLEGTLTRGRYVAFVERPIATGGMASICFGRLAGSVGFSRVVAIKRMHPHLAGEREFAAMFVDEARLVSRIRHANVVPTLDVVAEGGDLWIVMEYVHGESLSRLSAEGPIPPAIAIAIAISTLRGLHAAHEARDERGKPLGIVHRDVSPQNVMVGVDGLVRVVDFGVAKAADRLQTTRDGRVKGKIRYMAPEQLVGGGTDRRADVYAASVVLWEMLAGRRWITLDDQSKVMYEVAHGRFPRLRQAFADAAEGIDAILARGTSKDPGDRFATALEMAGSLESAAPSANAGEIGAWVERTALSALCERAGAVAAVENAPLDGTANLESSSSTRAAAEVPTANVGVTGFDPPPRRGMRVGVLLVGGVALVIAAVATRALWQRTGPGALATPAASTPSSSARAPSTPSSRAPLDSSATASVANTSTASAPTAAANPHRVAPAVSTKTTSRCDPPYTVEPNGTKRYRPECL